MKLIDWNKISESRKAKINEVKPIFILAPRDMSVSRILSLHTQLSAKASVVWGCLKDEYIPGFEGSPQFKSLALNKLETIENVQVLNYFHRDLKYILEELNFAAVILVNGSWHKMLHTNEFFWQIINKNLKYKLVSPFVNEAEALDYYKEVAPAVSKVIEIDNAKAYSEKEIMAIVTKLAKQSFATDWQTSAVLAKPTSEGKYQIVSSSHNVVVPYETYALHFGSVKEKNFSSPNDLNHYDTNHAEVELLINAANAKQDLAGTTLFINLMPCPTCSRMLARTSISEIVYTHDHSEGYAFKLFTEAGKTIRRIIY